MQPEALDDREALVGTMNPVLSLRPVISTVYFVDCPSCTCSGDSVCSGGVPHGGIPQWCRCLLVVCVG